MNISPQDLPFLSCSFLRIQNVQGPAALRTYCAHRDGHKINQERDSETKEQYQQLVRSKTMIKYSIINEFV